MRIKPDLPILNINIKQHPTTGDGANFVLVAVNSLNQIVAIQRNLKLGPLGRLLH